MKIFQFLINPDLNPDEISEIFCFEPKTIYEKKLGYLIFLGQAKGISFQKRGVLKELANFLEKKFYEKVELNPKEALRKTLKEGNEFLEKLKKENIRKLNLAVFVWKNWELNFSILGEIKIRLIRGEKVYDLNKKIKSEEEFLKVFGKIVGGKTIDKDLILVATKEVFEFLEKEKNFEKIAKSFSFNEKEFKKILENKKEELKKISGFCFFWYLTETERKLEFKNLSLRQTFALFLKENLTHLKKEIMELLQKRIWRLFLFFFLLILLALFLF